MEENTMQNNAQEQPKIDKVDIAATVVKLGIGLVTEIGVGIIFGSAADKILDGRELNGREKIATGIATTVVTGMVTSAADDYISNKVDSVVKAGRSIVSVWRSIREAMKEEE